MEEDRLDEQMRQAFAQMSAKFGMQSREPEFAEQLKRQIAEQWKRPYPEDESFRKSKKGGSS